MDFKFDYQVLETLIGGTSVLDVPKLNIQNLEQAHSFLKSYGFDVDKAKDEKKLWNYHRRAVTYIRTELLESTDEFPEILTDPNQLKNIAFILIYASTHDPKENSLQQWSCALLKIMHVFIHLDNDIFSQFSTQIQSQIIEPIKKHIITDPVRGTYLGGGGD